MAKLTSQKKSKQTSAKKLTTEPEKKQKNKRSKAGPDHVNGTGAASLASDIPPLDTPSSVATSTNGHDPSTLALPEAGVDLQERLRDMLKLAKEQGYLTYDDINEALPEGMADPEEMEQLLGRLRQMEVDIID